MRSYTLAEIDIMRSFIGDEEKLRTLMFASTDPKVAVEHFENRLKQTIEEENREKGTKGDAWDKYLMACVKFNRDILNKYNMYQNV